MKKSFAIIIPCVVLIFLSLVVVFLNNEVNDGFSNKVITFATNEKFFTMRNDGGTHYDTKYVIDFPNKKVTYYQSYYRGFQGWVYEDKVISTKMLTQDEIIEIVSVIKDIKENREEYGKDTNHTYMPYTLIDGDDEIILYNNYIISELEGLLN